MNDGDEIHLVMSNPPEVRACHVVEAWEYEQIAEGRADSISYGYTTTVELNESNDKFGD